MLAYCYAEESSYRRPSKSENGLAAVDVPVAVCLPLSGIDRPPRRRDPRMRRTPTCLPIARGQAISLPHGGRSREFLRGVDRAVAVAAGGRHRSRTFVDLGEAPAQLDRIRKALQVLRNMRPIDRFVSHSDVSVFARLFETGDAGRIASYLSELLAPIDRAAPRQRRAQANAADLFRRPAQPQPCG